MVCMSMILAHAHISCHAHVECPGSSHSDNPPHNHTPQTRTTSQAATRAHACPTNGAHVPSGVYAGIRCLPAPRCLAAGCRHGKPRPDSCASSSAVRRDRRAGVHSVCCSTGGQGEPGHGPSCRCSKIRAGRPTLWSCRSVYTQPVVTNCQDATCRRTTESAGACG